MSTTRRTRVRGTGFRKMGKFRPVLRYRAKKFIKPMPIPEKVIPIRNLELPEGFSMKVEKNNFTISHSNGSLSREYPSSSLELNLNGNNLEVKGKSHNKRVKALVGTFMAHIKNMIKGIEKPFVYKLSIKSVHFPMTANYSGSKFELKNFLGGKFNRSTEIPSNVELKLNGSDIELISSDIESVGMTATRLEQLTRVNKRDRRVFQDGIFITHKGDKKL